jgi:hypothetical protein
MHAGFLQKPTADRALEDARRVQVRIDPADGRRGHSKF